MQQCLPKAVNIEGQIFFLTKTNILEGFYTQLCFQNLDAASMIIAQCHGADEAKQI